MERPTVADWLEGLRRDGVATIDADIALDAERILAAWSAEGVEVSVEDAADALAARVATSAEQYEVVRRNFVRTFGEQGTAAPEESSATSSGGRRRRVRVGIVLAGLVVTAALLWMQEPGPPPPEPDLPVVVDEKVTERPTKAQPPPHVQVEQTKPEALVPHEGPVPWSSSMLAAMLGAGFVSMVLLVLGPRWLDAKRIATKRSEAISRQGIAARIAARERDGRDEREPYAYKVPPPMDVAAIDAAAALLGRPREDHEGTRLDVPRTVDHSARAGGRLVARFLWSHRQPPLLVLVDVEERSRAGQAHPLAPAVDWILSRWERTGLRLTRFDYKGRPDELWHAGSGRRVELKDLVRRHGDAYLLVWSRLQLPGDAEQRATWLAALRPWSQRAWIDLDRRPPVLAEGGADGRDVAELGRLDELERAGLERFPFTREGLVAAAYHVIGRARPPRLREDEPSGAELELALARWAAAACCVPDPTWMHLDVLRDMIPEVRRVLPEAGGVWPLLRWLERKGCLKTPALEARHQLALTDDADATLLRDDLEVEVDGGSQGLEQWVRARLSEQLEDAKPRTKNDEWLRRAKLAFQRCKVDLRGSVETLTALLGTPADGTARQLLARLLPRLDARTLPGRAEGLEKVVADSLGRRVRLTEILARPRWKELGIAVVVVAGMVGAANVVVQSAVERVRVVPAEYAVPDPDAKVPEPAELPKWETVRLELPRGARAMRLVRIEAGGFWMGSPPEEADHQSDEQRHWVMLTRPFWMCETEVTQAQWVAVMGTNPSDRQYGYGDDVAVHDVSWEMAVDFLNALSRKQGLTECYAKADEDWTWERSCEGYRLPTEAEWEYAARAGAETAYSFGNDPAGLEKHAWYDHNSGVEAHDVALKEANDRGLYDVHGNVWEWVWDWYESDYGSQARTDPSGPTTGEARVLRGGAFNNFALILRSANRNRDDPIFDYWFDGLRCVRGPHPSNPTVP